ncbi:uncharacterized protein EV154DRAFT_233627 [Mucor mucedo]|uniref:uncharacterized protein n=1 Tax=Mucor mucedo TaxID=29922 RepID=UPI0022200648|nr:uncharacterized protein EV154DRAFT_233627 [Mucor mucedo]KAI7891014.1 hypothetical protein EV154DRAFT_233627 [Mucor mucedo]
MPSVAKFHVFKEQNFHGLVYCDYCTKLLWGLAKGVHCTECGYNCHTFCSDMVIQCRPPRRRSPDSLSVTDSEAESVTRHSHRTSLDRLVVDDNNSNSSGRKRLLDGPKTMMDEKAANKAHRKSLKQQLQHEGSMSPHATAKAFTRLVARSRAFFYIGKLVHDIYSWKQRSYSLLACLFWISTCLYSHTLLLVPPMLILFLYSQNGVLNQPASQILFPRFDEHTSEYYMNLESMQYAFLFFIRIYDNFAYHLQHLSLTSTTYKILFVVSLGISSLFYLFGKWLIMAIGLMLLLNKTWVGSTLEILLQFTMEVLQTGFELVHKSTEKKNVVPREPIQVSLYENQRWWAGTGYTSQLLRSERSAWSNITGLEPLPSKEEMPSPTNYTWQEDDEWHLDTTGPWADDALEIDFN